MTSIATGIIGFPILSCMLLLLFSNKMSRGLMRLVGVGGIVLSFAATLALWFTADGLPYKQVLWHFLPSGMVLDDDLYLGLVFDSLSLTMTVVVTLVSSLIAIYSSEYMAHEDGFGRFFAGINLFVAFMLLLVLGDSLWLLFIGWEGVGLASYLLIGFFHREPKAVAAAMKAFLTTRVGDVFLLFAIFCAVFAFGTLDIASMSALAQANFPEGGAIITAISLLLLGGAVGKSAQLPLQTWLADAMWGPTPVSALIHAATMVTAGVYLLVRMSFLIVLSPTAQMAIMMVGLATLIMAGFAALAQTDMKRVLAYSTMSQIGYMFLAVGALSFQAAIFHLVTHAFFKALLFLSAGVIGHALHSYDMPSMGGLRTSFPFVFWCFIIGGTSLMGLPLVSSGFFSKEWILNDVASVPEIGTTLFYAAAFGTFLTALYTCRMIALVFFGTAKQAVHDHAGLRMYSTLVVLAIFSVSIGWLETPHFLGEIHVVSNFLNAVVPRSVDGEHGLLWLIPTIAAFIGAALGFARYRKASAMTFGKPSPWVALVKSGFGLDDLSMNVLVKPYQRVAIVLQPDFIKTSYTQCIHTVERLFDVVARMHTGRLSHYLSFMMVAMVALASIMVFS